MKQRSVTAGETAIISKSRKKDECAQKLKSSIEQAKQKNTFQVGDVIEWKEGLRHKRTEGPFVVVEVLDPPLIDPSEESGSCYYKEPLDLIVGTFVGPREDEFICVHVDSRRLQLIEAADETGN